MSNLDGNTFLCGHLLHWSLSMFRSHWMSYFCLNASALLWGLCLSWISDLGRLRLPHQKPGTTMPNGQETGQSYASPKSRIGARSKPRDRRPSRLQGYRIGLSPQSSTLCSSFSMPCKGISPRAILFLYLHALTLLCFRRAISQNLSKQQRQKKTKTSIYACIIEYENYITYHIISMHQRPTTKSQD